MDRNLTWLNSKWWYRLLKVLYIIIFVGLSIFSIVVAVDEFEPYQVTDEDTSTFQCTDGNNRTYTFRGLGHKISDFALRTGEVHPSTVANLCNIPNAFGEDINTVDSMDFDNVRRNLENEELVEAWKQDIANSFIIQTEYKTKGSWLYVILSSLAGIIGIFLFLEVLKRIFYYVLLGTLRPKK